VITFGGNIAVIGLHFTAFVEEVAVRRLIPQYEEDTGSYRIIALDGQLAFDCTIWKGEVPWSIIESGYTQEQNDADKVSFEGGYRDQCNLPMVPKGSDGTPASLPCLFPTGVYLYLAGSGDSETTRGAGDPFSLSSDAEGDSTLSWSFMDWVLIAGGGISCKGAESGDYATMEVYAPATPVTPNAGGTGNCNLVDPGVGADILIVPAAGNGAYDMDLATAVPVPAWNPVSGVCSGFFEWDKPNTGKGTISIGTPQASHFNLFAIDISLNRFANKLPLLGDGVLDFNIPAVEPKTVMPHWKWRVTLHNAGHTGLHGAWYITTARMQTV